ncbi:MAG: SGNH/GDSL hydrolase family protein [Luteolibacter sp.]
MKSLPLLACLALIAPVRAAELMPAFKAGDVVVFQGDSITDGGRARSGNDYNHTMGQDYVYIISARLSALLPERHLTFLNRGIGGNKLSDLAGRWKQDTLDLKPDILSILVGINDNGAHVPMAAFEQTYDKVLAETVAALPKVRLILCTPFTLSVGKYKDNFAPWDAEVKERAKIVEKLAAKYHAAVVRLQPLLDEACKKTPADYWLWDGIHPNYAGHALLSEEWIRVVNAAYGK